MDKAMEIRVNKAWEITDVKAQKKKKLPKLTGTSLKKKKKTCLCTKYLIQKYLENKRINIRVAHPAPQHPGYLSVIHFPLSLLRNH